MAINDNEKVDFLLKKFAYEISKTDLGSRKDPANEIIPSPLVVNSKNVWMQEIPLSSGDTKSYINRHLIQLNSGTVRTAGGYVPTWTANNSGNWISSTYGNDYVPKFYVGPIGQSTTAGLTAIVPGGTGNSDAFFFDYSAGVLHFAEDNVPSLLRSTNLTNAVYIQAFRYTGTTANSAFAGTGILVNDGSGVFSARTLSSGSNIVLSNANGKDGNPTIGLSSSVTGLTNLTSTSGIFSNKLAVSGSLTLNGRDITTSIEAIQNTNTANFSLSVGSVTDVGSNGGPSYYGTFDQGGNVREIMYSGSSATVAMRGGNFASDDQLVNTYRSSQTPTAEAPGFGFRLSSRENIGQSYRLNLSAGTGISVSGGIVHNFQSGDPLKFASDVGLPAVVASGVTYYVVGTGSTTFSVASGVDGTAISWSAAGNNSISAYSAYDYGSFVRVENSGNNANAGYGAVTYNYRIGKFEVTNDEYVEFLNAVARDDHDAANNFVDNVDMGLYSLLMETEAPNNGISRNASFPDYYYAALRGMNKKPVVFVSYMDAARYANWLHNGKPVSARYRVCSSIVAGMSNTATVTLANHGYSNGDLITFNCTDTSTFGGTLTRNTTFKVANVATNAFDVQTTDNGNVTFTGTGTFYVKRFFDKDNNVDKGAHTLSRNTTTAIAKNAIARYWVSTENEWYKAAYYDPAKSGVGSPGYWAYPTRSDTVPTPVSADSDGNGSYNGGGTIPSHNHSSYDISDFVDRIGGILDDGAGTQPIYNSSNSSIVINVTGIPLSTVTDVTATATEVNYLSGIVLGSGKASTVLALDINKNISGINNLTAGTGIFTSGSFAASLSADSASTLMVGGTGVSLSGHKHYYTAGGTPFVDIPNFCSGVADCLDTSLSASTGIIFNYSSNAVNVSLSGQALALHNLSTNGIIVRSGIGVVTSRTITSGVNINVTNGDGLTGNPTVALAVSVTGLNDLTVDQIKIDGSTISTTGNDTSITLAPNGTGDVNVDADTLRVGDSNANATITTNGTGDLTLNTNSGTDSSYITITDAANGDITLSANGTGEVNINRVDIDGGFIDGTTIGSGTAASGNFTVVTVDNTKIDLNKIYLSNVARIDLDASETIINSPGSGINFRVAGSGNAATNLLFVDSTNNRVGIGTNSPSSLFSVSGAVNFNSTITAPNIGGGTGSDDAVVLENGLLKTRLIDSRVWGSALVVSNGSTTPGLIPYWSDSNVLQDSNLFWDGSKLGIGTTSPQYLLDVRGDSYISGNLIVGNNLTISGTTVVANVDTMTVKDPIINLGLTQGNTIADTDYDRGLALSVSSTRTAFMGWDASASEFVMLSSGVPDAASGTYIPGTYGAFRAGTINSTGSFNGRVLNVTGTLNTAAGATNGQINLYGSNGNFISWNTNGQGAPTTSVRSSGTKLVLYPDLNGGNTDTAIGTDNAGQTLWHSIKTGAQASFKWYIGSTEKAKLDNSGNFATRGTITSNGAGGFTGNGSSITGVNAYGLNVYSNSLTDTVTSLVMVTGTDTGNLRPFIDSGLKFNANTNSLILENISGTLSTIFNSTTYNSVFSATSISGLAAFGSNNESYLLNFIIDGGTP